MPARPGEVGPQRIVTFSFSHHWESHSPKIIELIWSVSAPGQPWWLVISFFSWMLNKQMLFSLWYSACFWPVWSDSHINQECCKLHYFQDLKQSHKNSDLLAPPAPTLSLSITPVPMPPPLPPPIPSSLLHAVNVLLRLLRFFWNLIRCLCLDGWPGTTISLCTWDDPSQLTSNWAVYSPQAKTGL